MTTIERNARSLALLAPLACPTIDLLCALYVIVARQAHAIIEALKADHAARRALASHRAALLNPVHCPMNVEVPTVCGGIPPVLGDDDLIAEPALLRRLAEITSPSTCDDVVVTVAACQPIVERAEWVPMTGLQHFGVKVEHVDPAPARTSIEVDYVKVGEAKLTDAGRRINAANSACRCVATTKQGTRCKRDRAGKLFTCNQHKGYQPESMTLEAYASLLASNERDDANAD